MKSAEIEDLSIWPQPQLQHISQKHRKRKKPDAIIKEVTTLGLYFFIIRRYSYTERTETINIIVKNKIPPKYMHKKTNGMPRTAVIILVRST
jgi:uncharacterized protein (DUF111 family)